MAPKATALLLMAASLLRTKGAKADEIDDVRKRAEAYYDTMIPAYKEIGEKSHTIANNLINYAIYGSANEVTAAFEYSFDRTYYSYQKLDACFTSHDVIAKSLLSVMSKEPTDEKDRRTYWQANYGYSQLETFSRAMTSMQEIHSQCAGDLQRIRTFIALMKKYQREKLKICENVQRDLPYGRLVELLPPDRSPMSRLRKQWYVGVPLVTISGSTMSDGCPAVNPGCYSSGYVTFEGVRNQSTIDQSYQDYRARYPELAAATYLSFLALWNGYDAVTPPGSKAESVKWSPGSLNHMGEANLLANLVYLAGIYVQAEHQKRIDKLNKWIDGKEAELNALVAATYISEAEFEGQKAKSCKEQAGSFDQSLVDLLSFFDTVEQTNKIDSYLDQVSAIQNWYSSLFFYFVDNKLVDELAKSKLLSLRDQHYAALNASKVKADFAQTRQAIDGIQQEIARTRCAPDSNLTTIGRNLKKLVSRYQLFCDNTLQLYGLRTDQISFQGSAAYEGSVRCFYQGLDDQVKSVRILDEASGYASRIEALGESGSTLFSLSNVSSASQDSVIRLNPQFYCAVVGLGSFGTESGNRLQTGTYVLSPDVGLGTPAADISDLKKQIRQKADLIRPKVERCNALLPDSRRVALPDSTSCQLIGG